MSDAPPPAPGWRQGPDGKWYGPGQESPPPHDPATPPPPKWAPSTKGGNRLLWLGVTVAVVAAIGYGIFGGNDDSTKASSDSGTTVPGGESWSYRQLDGDRITIHESDSTGFVGDVPGPVDAIDAAIRRSGCAQLQLELDLWMSFVGNGEPTGERASAYANYALDVGEANGCSLQF